MPAAVSKSQLIAVTVKEYAKLAKTLENIDAETADLTLPGEDATIKDTIAHRTHWIDLFLGWYRDGEAGLPVQTPAPGYKWNQLKAYNSKVRAASQAMSWDQGLPDFQSRHTHLMSLLEGLPNSDLYTPHRRDWMNDWTLGRWAESAGASHYRSANTFIRKILRTHSTMT